MIFDYEAAVRPTIIYIPFYVSDYLIPDKLCIKPPNVYHAHHNMRSPDKISRVVVNELEKFFS